MSETRPPICDYEGSDYQSTFWDQGGREYEDQVEAIALRRLMPLGGKILLEIGAGAGRNTPRYLGFQQIVLLDYSRSQLRLAQERLGTGQQYIYVAADAYRLPFAPGVFDTITMIRTLHHLVDPASAIQQVSQALHDGGKFILEYANKQNFKAVIRYLARRQTWSPFDRQPVEFAKLNFDFHPAAVRDWLNQAGFSIERQLTVSHFRIGVLKRSLPLNWLVRMDALAQWSGNWWQLTPSVFVRARATASPGLAASGTFFRCPECRHFPLDDGIGRMACQACGREYAVQDGIYDFRSPIASPPLIDSLS
jgi:ubiquinone/menaquinone biosynthesis C-methylase UbiE